MNVSNEVMKTVAQRMADQYGVDYHSALQCTRMTIDRVKVAEKNGVEITPAVVHAALHHALTTMIRDSERYFNDADYREEFNRKVKEALYG